MTPHRRRTAALGALLLVSGWGVPISGAEELPVPHATVQTTLDRTIADQRVTESSGLIASSTQPGVVWTLNDSGNAAELYAIDPRGAVAAVVKLPGVRNRDWEALSAWTSPKGNRYFLIGDIGDNSAKHQFSHIYVIAEPAVRNGNASLAAHLQFTYATGPSDAEALAVDPVTNHIWIVTKGVFGSIFLRIDAKKWLPAMYAGGLTELVAEPAAQSSAGLVTDAAALPDGSLLLRTYSEVYRFAPVPVPSPAEQVRLNSRADSLPRIEPVATAKTGFMQQSETLAVIDKTTLLIGSEGVNSQLLRAEIPDPANGTTGPGAAAEGDATAAGAADAAAASQERSIRARIAQLQEQLRIAVLVVVASALGLAAIGWTTLRRKKRRGSSH